MARKGRIPKEGARTPSGKLSRAMRSVVQPISPSAMARLRDACIAGLTDPLWGSELGRMHLRGEIDVVQMEAGRRWGSITGAYKRSIGAKGIKSPACIGAGGAAGPDPDSEEGARVAEYEAGIAEAYSNGLAALQDCGARTVVVVGHLVDDKSISHVDKFVVKAGLTALALHFGLTKRPNRA